MAMNLESWTSRLREVAANLASLNFDVQMEVGDPVPEDEMQREESYYAQTTGLVGFRFHESLRSLYKTAAHLSFRWKTPGSRDLPPLFGATRLVPLAMLYEDDPGEIASRPWYGVWRVLDEVGIVTQVMIRFDKTGKAEVGWCSTEGGIEVITPLALTVSEYFEYSLAACCLHGWPLLFSAKQSTLAQDHVDDLLTAIERISPPANPDPFKARR